MPPPSRARALAPLALVGFLIVFVLILAGARGGSHHKRHKASAPTPRLLDKKGRPKRCYRVKPGQLLSTIAQKTGVPVKQLQQLNKGLDPNAVQAGQLIRISPGGGHCGRQTRKSARTG